jgi:hypothetical protein
VEVNRGARHAEVKPVALAVARQPVAAVGAARVAVPQAVGVVKEVAVDGLAAVAEVAVEPAAEAAEVVPAVVVAAAAVEAVAAVVVSAISSAPRIFPMVIGAREIATFYRTAGLGKSILR